MKNEIKERARRTTPPVAALNKKLALENINKKINILREWANSVIPAINEKESLDFYPKSVRQFNLWDGSQNSLCLGEDIKKNANDTLRSYPLQLSEVVQLIETLQLRATEQIDGSKKIRIGKIKAELAVEKRLRQIGESALIALRRELKLEQVKHQQTISRSESQLNELKREISRLSEDNIRLAQENANLIAIAAKVRPIRGVDK